VEKELKRVALVSLIATIWAVAWGMCGLAIALVGTRISPDTGHVPHGLVAIILASIGAVTGFFSGIVYSLVSQTTSFTSRRTLVGAAIGAASIITLISIGAIRNTSARSSLISNLEQVALSTLIFSSVAAGLGAVLGALDAKIRPCPFK
jgi:uncharacterized protein YacL